MPTESTAQIERSNQKNQFTVAELREFVKSSRKPPAPLKTQTKQVRDAATARSFQTLETQAAMNRGVKFPTVSERRDALRKLEVKAEVTDSKIARIS